MSRPLMKVFQSALVRRRTARPGFHRIAFSLSSREAFGRDLWISNASSGMVIRSSLQIPLAEDQAAAAAFPFPRTARSPIGSKRRFAAHMARP